MDDVSVGTIRCRGRRSVCAALAVLLVMCTGHAYAGQAEDALNAVQVGDYGTAARLWSALAQSGDVSAQYNMALLYRAGQGVPPDGGQAAAWLHRAARQGLVDAYVMLRGSDTEPAVAADTQALATQDPRLWIYQQNPDYYTLQLASSKSLPLIQKYIADNNLAGRAGYYKSVRNGEDWYALVYGAYSSIDEAQAAIPTLPEGLRKWSPWVRKYQEIHRIMNR